MNSYVLKLILYVSNFIAVLVSVPCHEFAHAFAAVKNGDDTPKYTGRYTLNPFAHFDLLGLVMMIVFRFGWAKPVMVNPSNFRNYKKGAIWVSIAGVLANLALAFLFCPVAMIVYNNLIANGFSSTDWTRYLKVFLWYICESMFYLNISLFVFNLLPFYPLDGFRLIDSLSTRRGGAYWFLYRYGRYCLLGIFLLSYIADRTGLYYINVIGVIRDIVAYPINAFWGLFI
ncbi:MAG: site-2 protease family protein [Clostridia bacterium]|nr:site-2 protease family protein [Clostridia bacterium]